MNTNVKWAIDNDEFSQNIPQLEIGDIVCIYEVWDGEGEEPCESYSYQIDGTDVINFEFEDVNATIDDCHRVVQITAIDII